MDKKYSASDANIQEISVYWHGKGIDNWKLFYYINLDNYQAKEMADYNFKMM